MLRVLADDAHDTFALDHLALVTDLFNGCSYFHILFRSPQDGPAIRGFAGPLALHRSCFFPKRITPSGRPNRQRLLVPVEDPAARQVVGRELHQYPIARKDPDKVHADLTGNVRENLVPALQLNPEYCIRQVLRDDTLHLDPLLFCIAGILGTAVSRGTAITTARSAAAGPTTTRPAAAGASTARPATWPVPTPWSSCHTVPFSPLAAAQQEQSPRLHRPNSSLPARRLQ